MPTRRLGLPDTLERKRSRKQAAAALCIMVALASLLGGFMAVYASRISDYADFFPFPGAADSALSTELSVRLSSLDDCGDYYRRNLSDRGQETYDRLEDCVRAFAPVAYLPDGTTYEELRCAMRFMLADNPDIFWCDGRGSYKKDGGRESAVFDLFQKEPSSDTVVSAFSPMYLRTEDDVTAEAAGYVSIAKSFFADDSSYAPAAGKQDATQDAKLRLILCYLADNLEYKHMAKDDQTIASALGSDESVCAGYSKAACYIARENDIPCIYIGGEAVSGLGTSNGNHAWIAANLDGPVVYCDPLWYDNISPGKGFYDIKWFASDPDMFARYHKPFFPQLLPEGNGDQEMSGSPSSSVSASPATNIAFSM